MPSKSRYGPAAYWKARDARDKVDTQGLKDSRDKVLTALLEARKGKRNDRARKHAMIPVELWDRLLDSAGAGDKYPFTGRG
jgi:hypothetical protein